MRLSDLVETLALACLCFGVCGATLTVCAMVFVALFGPKPRANPFDLDEGDDW